MSDDHRGLPHDLPEYTPNVPPEKPLTLPGALVWVDKIQAVILAAQNEGFMLWISDDGTQGWAQVRLGMDEDPGDGGHLVLEWKKRR